MRFWPVRCLRYLHALSLYHPRFCIQKSYIFLLAGWLKNRKHFLCASWVFLKVNWPKNPNFNTRKLYEHQNLPKSSHQSCFQKYAHRSAPSLLSMTQLKTFLTSKRYFFIKIFFHMWKSWGGWLNQPPPNSQCVHARKRVEIQTWRRHRSMIAKHDC